MHQQLAAMLQAWPKEPQESARRLEEYGEPQEYSSSQPIWYDTKDGWKRIVLSREEIPHKFPAPHTDF